MRHLLAPLRLAVFAAFAASTATAADTIDITPWSAPDRFGELTISPDGKYLAATVVQEDRTGVAIIDRASKKMLGMRSMGEDTIVRGVRWVSDGTIVFGLAQAFGTADEPASTGELFAMDVDDVRDRVLVGWRRTSASAGTLLDSRTDQRVAAQLVDDLPGNDDEVLVGIWPFRRDPVTTLERLDVDNGRRRVVTRAPVMRGSFTTDHAGRARFVVGIVEGNASRLYHRADDTAEWTLVNDEDKSGVIEIPVGFAKDNRIAWLQVERKDGPDALVAYDTTTGERRTVLAHDIADPAAVLTSLGPDPVPAGAMFIGPRYDYGFLDPASDTAALYKMLLAAFPGQAPVVTSTTADGRLAVVQVFGPHNPGEFYLFDTQQKSAEFLLRRREGVPKELGEVRGIAVKARDGMTLHGYLTLPPGSDGRGLPMVVHPHGGPFGVQDMLGFDPHVQMLARAGYAVLQLNHRGSSGYGRRYLHAGGREWGRKLQHDLTDATRWAIDQGIADEKRICIYGASYGGYAAMMGVVNEPGLYKCAVGYVGVYDLDDWARPDALSARSSAQWLSEWVGQPGELGAVSPVKLADRIDVPVLLASGGADRVVPVEHSKRMEKALRDAGQSVDVIHYETEGHGYYTLEHRRAFDVKLLDFLARHIGGARAAPAAGD